MVNVVDEGTDPLVVKRVVCSNCGATLEYVPIEVKKYSGTDMGGGPDGREWIVCPKCHKEVTTKSW